MPSPAATRGHLWRERADNAVTWETGGRAGPARQPLISQDEPAGVDRVDAGDADRRLFEVHRPAIHTGVEQDEGVGRGGEVADLAGTGEIGAGEVDNSNEREGLVAIDHLVGIDRVDRDEV